MIYIIIAFIILADGVCYLWWLTSHRELKGWRRLIPFYYLFIKKD